MPDLRDIWLDPLSIKLQIIWCLRSCQPVLCVVLRLGRALGLGDWFKGFSVKYVLCSGAKPNRELVAQPDTHANPLRRPEGQWVKKKMVRDRFDLFLHNDLNRPPSALPLTEANSVLFCVCVGIWVWRMSLLSVLTAYGAPGGSDWLIMWHGSGNVYLGEKKTKTKKT